MLNRGLWSGLLATASAVVASVALASPPAFAGTMFDLSDYTETNWGPDATFQFTTHTPYWSAVRLESVSGGPDMKAVADFDLTIRKTGTSTAVTSEYGAQETDFVAIDSNRAPCANHSYAADVRFYAGSHDAAYSLMLAQGANMLTTYQLPLASSALVPNATGANSRYGIMVRDVYLVAGKPVEVWGSAVTATPSPIWVMGTDPAQPDQCVKNRASALARGTLSSGNISKALTFTPPTSGYYGFVNISGLGNAEGTNTVIVGQTR